jgi:GT2 family glycosyltransferase
LPASPTETIAVVLLNWNGADWLRRFLPGVVANSAGATLIVVDNASSDDSVAVLAEAFPTVEVITHSANLGFCDGYNRALAQLEGRFEAYVLLNTDVEVTPGWLEPLCARLFSEASIAAVQPKIRSYAIPTDFEYAGAAGGLIDRFGFPFCRGRLFDTLEPDAGQYNDARPVFWATGACMLVRATAWHALGGLESRFFAHMEEIDFCWRAHQAGWQVWAEPASVVYHVGGGTLHKSNPRKTYLNFRNGLALLLKNLAPGELIGTVAIRLGLDWLAAGRWLVSGDWRDATAVFKAHWHVLRSLGYWRAQRRRLRPRRSITTLPGVYAGSIVWAYFGRKVRRAVELDT